MIRKFLNKCYNRLSQEDAYAEQICSIYWGQIYNSTIADSTWLLDKSISPGRWAVGYGFLYVLYRCLNDVHPQNVLELGLGQSTKVIGQYVTACGQSHIVVEHDKTWKDFFLQGWHKLSDKSMIEILPLKRRSEGQEEWFCYDGFKNLVTGRKFDCISIDGPWGGDGKYSRRDILECLPDILADDFIMMFDDCGRIGEKTTVAEAEKILLANNIVYKKGSYSEGADKTVNIIVSEKWGFLCSL